MCQTIKLFASNYCWFWLEVKILTAKIEVWHGWSRSALWQIISMLFGLVNSVKCERFVGIRSWQPISAVFQRKRDEWRLTAVKSHPAWGPCPSVNAATLGIATWSCAEHHPSNAWQDNVGDRQRIHTFCTSCKLCGVFAFSRLFHFDCFIECVVAQFSSSRLIDRIAPFDCVRTDAKIGAFKLKIIINIKIAMV